MKFLAFTTKGLTEISIQEIKDNIFGCKIEYSDEKIIIFDSNLSLEKFINLKTIDDICLLISSFEFENLFEIFEKLKYANFQSQLNLLSNFRKINTDYFSITFSFYKTNIEKNEFSEKIITTLSSLKKWKYEERKRDNLDFRIVISENSFLLGLRIGKESLIHRSYQIEKLTGALKPTIASSLVFMAKSFFQNNSDLKLVDNLCGSGTILIEGLKQGFEVYGGDINSKSIDITRKNLQFNNYYHPERIKIQDCKNTNFPNKFFDCAVSNLPWGKQIELKDEKSLIEGCLKEYKRILKDKGIIILLLKNKDRAIKIIKELFGKNTKIQIRQIGFYGQKPYVIIFQNIFIRY